MHNDDLGEVLAGIRNGGAIFALALSRDGELIACGGEAGVPVTVWRLRDGSCLASLEGLPRQAHALAFSADGERLAAANLWGGLCVWSLASGHLLEQIEDTTARKFRELVYPDTAPTAIRPLMLSSSIHSGSERALSPNGRWLARRDNAIVLKLCKYRSTRVVEEWHADAYAISASGMRSICWSADGTALAMAGDGWIGAWSPGTPTAPGFATALPFADRVDALARSDTHWLYAKDGRLAALPIPLTPLAPQDSAWLSFLRTVPPPPQDFKPRREWTWNHTPNGGHDGVHTLTTNSILWFNVTYPAYAGGFGADQSFAEFLAQGPYLQGVPEATLIELVQAVRLLVDERPK